MNDWNYFYQQEAPKKTIEETPHHLFRTPNVTPREKIEGYQYRDWFVTRLDHPSLWKVLTLQGGKPPIPLQGTYTNIVVAKAAIDGFLESEAIQQAAADQALAAEKAELVADAKGRNKLKKKEEDFGYPSLAYTLKSNS